MALLVSVPISSSSSLYGGHSWSPMYPGFASSNFLSVPTFGFIYTLKSMDWYWFSACRLPIGVLSKSFDGICLSTPVGKGLITVKALSDSKGTGPDSWQPLSESDDEEEDVVLDKIPLDSKLQLKLEHKMKMKFGKKIRLRRKKLDRKRGMRKRGKWPPLKANKLKNIEQIQIPYNRDSAVLVMLFRQKHPFSFCAVSTSMKLENEDYK
ncbi:hypothetical protein NC651_015002 [Populus alba x Populus x berolinensis]|nr:hypothetical protein NC651_015002 [Populus alba x Populus x berolinensis]